MDKSAAYLTLGCDKNRVDTERTLGALDAAGWRIVQAPEPAFALVVNTCGFIDAAKEESVAAVMEGIRAKEEGLYRVVAIVGCLSERYKRELIEEIPEADAVLGTDHVDKLWKTLNALWERENPGLKREIPRDINMDIHRAIVDIHAREGSDEPRLHSRIDPFSAPTGRRILTTPDHYAFLKICDGCNSACRFCAIPRIRGKLRSEDLDRLVKEAKALERAGVKELYLVGQDVTAYGKDLSPGLELADLIRAILDKTSIPWIRLLYGHPSHVTDRLIELLANEDRLLHYLDLPLQHASDKVLAAMGRSHDKRSTMELLDKLESRVPGLVLRSTFLVGYPGEGDAEFEELLDLVEEGRFLWASGFTFSPQEGTPAKRLPDRVPEEVAEERLSALLEAQREVTARKLSELVGRKLPLLVDEPWPPLIEEEEGEGETVTQSSPNEWAARFSGMAVEVDGLVRLVGDARPGEIIEAEITDCLEYDLEAESGKQ